MLLLKVTKVTTGHQKLPKMGQNSIISPFFARRAKKASAEGRSPPQELEVSPRSGLYLLVTPKAESFLHPSHINLMSILTPNPSTALRQNHSSTPPHINLPPILTQNPSINPGPESVLHPPHLNLSPPLQQNPFTNPDLSLPVKVFSVQTMPPLQPLPHPYSRQEDISKPPSTFCDQHFRTEAGIQVMPGVRCKAPLSMTRM